MQAIQFHKTQSEVAKDNTRFRTVLCGRRWGKTTYAIFEMVGKAMADDDKRIAYIAPNYQMSRDIAWNQLKRTVEPITVNTNEQRLEIEIRSQKGGSSFIFLRGWESIETLRGQFFDFLVLDEVASYRNFWTGWHEVLRPTLTDKQGHALFIGTPKGFNHFYDLYNTKGEDYKSFHFTTYDNPFIQKSEIEKTKEEISEDRFAQEYLADFRKTEGIVYKEFDRERHVKEVPLIGGEEIIVGVDFGYTNPAAVLKIVKINDNFHVADEWYKTKQSTQQIIGVMKPMKPNRVYPDPAEPDRIAMIEESGLYCETVSKDIVAGIDKVHEILKQGRLSVDPKCINLIYEFETYAYPDSKGEKNADEKPVKQNDHALDALRYVLYSNDVENYNFGGKHKTGY